MKKIINMVTPIGSIRGEGLVIPNHSGDHSAGIVNTTPTTNTDIANKKYVDDHDYWAQDSTNNYLLYLELLILLS